MINSSLMKSSLAKSPETLLKTVAEVLEAKRDKTPLNSLRIGDKNNNFLETNSSQKKSPRAYRHRPSRLNNYHIDAIEESKHAYRMRSKKSPPAEKHLLDSPYIGSIEADKRNLHNVFGMPLKSHWVFRGGEQ